MKLRMILPTVAVIVAAALSGCGNSKADEAAALEAFKREVKSLNALGQATEHETRANPMALVDRMKEAMARLRAMQNDKLPTDLKEAFAAFVEQIGKMQAILTEMGPDAADIMKKAAADPQFMQRYATKVNAMEADVRRASALLDAVLKSYGIEKIGGMGTL